MADMTAYVPPLKAEGSLMVYHFETGGFIAVVYGGKESTEERLQILSQLIDLKRHELTKASP